MHDVVVIGAGPCGLGAVRELARLGIDDVVVLEAADRAGGLASSTVDEAGFTWDRGGHVVFSHYGAFDELLAEVLGDEVLHHDRSSCRSKRLMRIVGIASDPLVPMIT